MLVTDSTQIVVVVFAKLSVQSHLPCSLALGDLYLGTTGLLLQGLGLLLLSTLSASDCLDDTTGRRLVITTGQLDLLGLEALHHELLLLRGKRVHQVL